MPLVVPLALTAWIVGTLGPPFTAASVAEPRAPMPTSETLPLAGVPVVKVPPLLMVKLNAPAWVGLVVEKIGEGNKAVRVKAL